MMISDLPCDLESEILSRVPAKSLAKLQTTCKRWYKLFKDPKFIKKKLGTTPKEVILLMNSRVYSVSLNLHGIHNPSMDFTGKLSRIKDSKVVKISKIFDCDGLMLCSTVGNKRLAVWNPCTGEHKWIKPRTCYKSLDKYVLGYGNSNLTCRSYKILRFCCYFNVELQLHVAEFEIYDLNSNSWRVLDITRKWGMLLSHGVSLKGNTYWVASDKEADLVHVLLSFDFTTERFVYRPLPFQNYDTDLTEVLSVVREEKLALLHNNKEFEVKIWMTNAKIDEAKNLTWINFLEVNFDKFTRFTSVISFLVDEEQKNVVCCVVDDKCKTGILIVGEDIHKEVHKENTKGSYGKWPLLFSYVPSLAQIRRNTPKGKRKRNTRGG